MEHVDLQKLLIEPTLKVFGVCALCFAKGEVTENLLPSFRHLTDRYSLGGLYCASCFTMMKQIEEIHKKEANLKEEMDSFLIGVNLLHRQKRAEIAKISEVEGKVIIIKQDIKQDKFDEVKEEEKFPIGEKEEEIPCSGSAVETGSVNLINSLNGYGDDVCLRGTLTIDKNSLSCYFCHATRSDVRGLYEHMKGQHLREQHETCPALSCGFRTASRSVWRAHLQRFHQKEYEQYLTSRKIEQKCPHCSKTFKYHHILLRHLEIHQAERKKYPCSSCEKSFFSQDTLNYHNIGHHGGRGGRLSFLCPYRDCKARPSHSQAYLTRHIRIVHEQDPVTCKRCGKFFKNELALKSLQRLSKKCNLTLHPCPFPPCKVSFLFKFGLS